MKKIKALSVALAAVMSFSCLGMNAFAEVGAPEDYASLASNIDSDILSKWEAAALGYLEVNDITANDHTITFSEPYCVYNFYDMDLDSGEARLVYVDGELYGYSSADIENWQDYGVVSAPVCKFDHKIIKEKLSDAVANGKTVLFGRAFINGLPNNLIYIDGEIYSPNSIIYTDGTTDLEFGNIPYSEFAGGSVDEDGNLLPGTVIPSGNSSVTYAPGDVDKDGIITGHDAAMVSRYVTESDYSLTAEQLSLADIDGDGSVTQADADMIYNARVIDLGDINKDGNQDLEDASMISTMCYMKYILDPDMDFGSKEIIADVDCNGTMDYVDSVTNLTMFARRGAHLDNIYNEGKYCYIMTEEEKQEWLDVIRESAEAAGAADEFDFTSINSYNISCLKRNLVAHMNVDGDHELTLNDAATVLTAYANQAAGITAIYGADDDAESTDISSYDVNYDDEVDINDASLILKTYAMNAAGLL